MVRQQDVKFGFGEHGHRYISESGMRGGRCAGISPHSEADFFAAFAFRTISRNARRIGADMVSKRSETLALPRSTANRNWNRALDPTDTKSTFFRSSSS